LSTITIPHAPAKAMPELVISAESNHNRPPEGFVKLDGNVHVAVRTVSPDVAAYILAELNTRNRRMKEGSIQEYARDMAKWEWALNGEPLIFDGATTLLNGQNRLAACVVAGVPFDTLVVWGARSESMFVMDRGVKRTVADVFGLNNIQYAALVGGAVNVINAYRRGLLGSGRGGRQTVSEALATATELSEDLTATIEAVSELFGGSIHVGPLPGMSPSLVVGLYYMTSQYDADLAREFWGGVIGGERLEAGDARLALRNVLIRERAGVRSRQSRVAGLTIKAWNYWLESRYVRLLRFGNNEEFPSVFGFKPYGYETENGQVPTRRRPGAPKQPKTLAHVKL
jgi:hypothetical protein